MKRKERVVNFLELSMRGLTGFNNREIMKKMMLISMTIGLMAFSTFAQSISVRLMVSNLPATATESELKSFFNQAGIETPIVQLVKTNVNGKPLLTGLVKVDVSNAEKAINLAKAKQFMGNTISIGLSAADKAKVETHKKGLTTQAQPTTQPKPVTQPTPTVVAAPTPVVAAQPVPLGKLVVLEFANKADNQFWWHGGGAATQDIFVNELIGTKMFQVIDREKLEQLFQEKNLTLSGEISAANAVKIGKLLGVNYLLTGTVTKYGLPDDGNNKPGGLPGFSAGNRKFEAAIKVQLVNTATGKAVWSDELSTEETSTKVSVGGFGGGVDDQRMFDTVMKRVIQKAVANLKAANLKP